MPFSSSIVVSIMLIIVPYKKYIHQGISQQSESGMAKPQIVLKVGGGKNGKLMASISDFDKK